MNEQRLASLNAARSYLGRGIAVIPVPPRSKRAVLDGWSSLRLTDAQLPSYFCGEENIGLLLGEPSDWLVDVDLDCGEALRVAPHVLPATLCKTGRPSNPDSHYWYRAVGAKTRQFRDPFTNEMVIELRSTGAQTVVGPSIHPSGEAYDRLIGTPSDVDAGALLAAVGDVFARVVKERYGELPIPALSVSERTLRPSTDTDEQVIRRATRYLDQMPPAISGCGGHARCYAAAVAMVHGFGIAPERSLNLLKSRYNPRCEPPWSDRELQHKVNDAHTKSHERPYGWLRDTVREPSPIPLSMTTNTEPQMLDSSEPNPSVVEEEDLDVKQEGDPPADPGPLPQHLLSVPGFINQVIEYNRSTAPRWQPTLALAGAICLQAVLAGRKVRDERGNRTNLYVVGLAGSGSGKDNARSVNKNVLAVAGVDLEAQEDLASDAGLVAAVEAQPACLLQIDEFGRWLRTIGDPKKAPHLFNVISTLMKFYSSAKGIFRGKAYADAKRNKTIDQPCVSLFATTAPEHFKQALTPEAMTDGFMARLVVFETGDMPERVWAPELEPPEPLVEAARWWDELCPGGNLGREHPNPIVVPTTPEAREVFNALAARADASMVGAAEDVRSVLARVEEKACRLALVYACSRNRMSPEIDVDAAGWACELSEHLTKRVLFMAHEYMAHGEFDAKQKSVLRSMRKHGNRLSRSQYCRATQHFTVREREDVLRNLVETGRVRELVEPTKGRKRTTYVLLEGETG